MNVDIPTKYGLDFHLKVRLFQLEYFFGKYLLNLIVHNHYNQSYKLYLYQLILMNDQTPTKFELDFHLKMWLFRLEYFYQ
jgi:hypothetical protein